MDKTPDEAREPRRRHLFKLLGLSAAVAYAAPAMIKIAPASAQSRMTRSTGSTRVTRLTRITRPSR